MAQVVAAKVDDREKKRRRRAITGSKTGIIMASLFDDLSKVKAGFEGRKFEYGLTKDVGYRLVCDVLDSLALMRDAYVDERIPRGD